MKTIITTAVGLAAAGVSAQSYGSASTTTHPTATFPTPLAPSYTTIIIDECTSAAPPVPSTVTPITATDTTTKTFCPLCTETSASRPGQYTTTYETVYPAFCSTGLAPSTYTVTAPCTETGVTYPSTYVPPGFTVTSTVCTSCGTAPITATLTMPKSCISSAVAPTTAAAGMSTPPAGPGSNPAPAPGFNPVPGPQPANYVTNGTIPLSSPPVASPPVASPMPSTSPIMPYEGGATRMSMSLEMFVGVMGLVGAGAFAL